jgi:hypothetical protein
VSGKYTSMKPFGQRSTSAASGYSGVGIEFKRDSAMEDRGDVTVASVESDSQLAGKITVGDRL